MSHLLQAEEERPCVTLEHLDCELLSCQASSKSAHAVVKDVDCDPSAGVISVSECETIMPSHQVRTSQSGNDLNQTSDGTGTVVSPKLMSASSADTETGCRTNDDCVLKKNVDVSLPNAEARLSDCTHSDIMQCSAADKLDIDDGKKFDDVTTSCCSEADASAAAACLVESVDEAAKASSQSDSSHTASSGVVCNTGDVIEQVNDAVTSPLMYSDADSSSVPCSADELCNSHDCTPCPSKDDVLISDDDIVPVNHSDTETEKEGLPGKTPELLDGCRDDEAKIVDFSLNTDETLHVDNTESVGLSHDIGERLNAADAADIVSIETVKQFAMPDENDDVFGGNVPVNNDNGCEKLFEVGKNCVLATVCNCDVEVRGTEELRDGLKFDQSVDQPHPDTDDEKHTSRNKGQNTDDDHERLSTDMAFKDCEILSEDEHQVDNTTTPRPAVDGHHVDDTTTDVADTTAHRPAVDRHFDRLEDFQPIPCTTSTLDDFVLSQPCPHGSQLLSSQSSTNQELNFTQRQTLGKPPHIEPGRDDDDVTRSPLAKRENTETCTALSDVSCVTDSSPVLLDLPDDREFVVRAAQPDKYTDHWTGIAVEHTTGIAMEHTTGIDVLASVCECLVNVDCECNRLGFDEAGEVHDGDDHLDKPVEVWKEKIGGECSMLNTAASAASYDQLTSDVISGERDVTERGCFCDSSKSCDTFSTVREEHDLDDSAAPQTYEKYLADAENCEELPQSKPDSDDNEDQTGNNIAEPVAADDDDDDDDDEYASSCDVSSELREFSIDNETDTDVDATDYSSSSDYDSDEGSDADCKSTDGSSDLDYENTRRNDDVMVLDVARECDETVQLNTQQWQNDENGRRWTLYDDTCEESKHTGLRLPVNSTAQASTESVNHTEYQIKESFATVPDNDQNDECSELSKEVRMESVPHAVDQSKVCASGRKCISLEGCSGEFWLQYGVPEDPCLVEKKEERQVPCDVDNYNTDDDDDDDDDDGGGDFHVVVADCGQSVNSDRDTTVHTKTNSSDVDITSEAAAITDYDMASESADNPPSKPVTSRLDHPVPHDDLLPLKPGGHVEMFGVEDDHGHDLCRTSEDEVFYTDCEVKQEDTDLERVGLRTSFMQTTEASSSRTSSGCCEMCFEGARYSCVSRDQQVLDDSISKADRLVSSQPSYHSNDKPAAAAVTSVTTGSFDTAVASSNTNLLDYCNSVSDADAERRDQLRAEMMMMTMTSGTVTSRDDQTVEESVDEISSEELLYTADHLQSPPSMSYYYFFIVLLYIIPCFLLIFSCITC